MSECYISHGDSATMIYYLNHENKIIQLILDWTFNSIYFHYNGCVVLTNDIQGKLDEETIPVFKKLAFHALNEIKESSRTKKCLTLLREIVDLYV